MESGSLQWRRPGPDRRGVSQADVHQRAPSVTVPSRYASFPSELENCSGADVARRKPGSGRPNIASLKSRVLNMLSKLNQSFTSVRCPVTVQSLNCSLAGPWYFVETLLRPVLLHPCVHTGSQSRQIQCCLHATAGVDIVLQTCNLKCTLQQQLRWCQ